jgi:hypothetical protein
LEEVGEEMNVDTMLTGEYKRQQQHYIKVVQEAEQILALNKTLLAGLRLSDEELDKAKELAQAARESGAPDLFLRAVAEMNRKPLVMPRRCWWCRVKRWVRR